MLAFTTGDLVGVKRLFAICGNKGYVMRVIPGWTFVATMEPRRATNVARAYTPHPEDGERIFAAASWDLAVLSISSISAVAATEADRPAVAAGPDSSALWRTAARRDSV
ncbi:hypothetical protein GCM10023319_74230 [Nocardia iowensis]